MLHKVMLPTYMHAHTHTYTYVSVTTLMQSITPGFKELADCAKYEGNLSFRAQPQSNQASTSTWGCQASTSTWGCQAYALMGLFTG